jgi:hypothetical protein
LYRCAKRPFRRFGRENKKNHINIKENKFRRRRK